MTMLRNAADEASRAGLAYFDLVAHGVPVIVNGDGRGMSLPPGRLYIEDGSGRKRKAQDDEDGGVKRRRKRTVKPKDPNAPKKPATPYFLFCTEGRNTVKNDMGANATFRDVQAELKTRWEALSQEEKNVGSPSPPRSALVADRTLGLVGALPGQTRRVEEDQRGLPDRQGSR
jgi:hypothetical protein